MPKAPLPDGAAALLREPNPAVIAVVMPNGHPMSVATWYLVEDDGTVLVNMDAGRARLSWMQQHPHVSLTALKDGEWYTHVSVRGPVVRWEHDEAEGARRHRPPVAPLRRRRLRRPGRATGSAPGSGSTTGTAGTWPDRIPERATGRARPYYRGPRRIRGGGFRWCARPTRPS